MWEIISSIVTGGATGLLGVGISGVLEHFKQKQRNNHELSLMQAEREMMAMEIQGRERVAAIEAESAESIEEMKLMSQSIAADRATYSSGSSPWLVFVDVVRGLTRPMITLLLIILTAIIWFSADDAMQQQKVVATVLYITTAAVLWWFGSRVRQPK